MKKNKFIFLITLIIILIVNLTGCSAGTPIAFARLKINLHNDLYQSRGSRAYLIRNEAGLNEFLEDSALWLDSDQNLPNDFFNDNALLIVRHTVYSEETYKVKSVKIKENKLTVSLDRKYTDKSHPKVYYLFLSVNKSDVEDITNCVVLETTTEGAFNPF